MPDAADRPAKPVLPRRSSDGGAKPGRTWRPMVLWSAGILAFACAAWALGALIMTVRETEAILDRNSSMEPDSYLLWNNGGPEAVAALGGQARALTKLRLYLALPERLANRKWTAVLVLGSCGKPAVPTLVKALGSKYAMVRRNAAVGLNSLGQDAEEAIPALIRTLGQKPSYKDLSMRREVILCLWKMGPKAKAAVDVLVAEFTDASRSCPVEAAMALGAIGPDAKAAVPALETALTSTDSLLRSEAAEALRKIRGEEPPR